MALNVETYTDLMLLEADDFLQILGNDDATFIKRKRLAAIVKYLRLGNTIDANTLMSDIITGSYRSQCLKESAQGADAHERRVLAKDADTHKIGEHIRKSQDKCHTEGDRKKTESSKKEESSSDEEFESDSNVSSDEEEIEQSNHNGCGCCGDKCDFYPDECEIFYVDDGD